MLTKDFLHFTRIFVLNVEDAYKKNCTVCSMIQLERALLAFRGVLQQFSDGTKCIQSSDQLEFPSLHSTLPCSEDMKK
jgi:hypothetical protein